MLTENTKRGITGHNCIIFLFNIKYKSIDSLLSKGISQKQGKVA